MTVAAQVSLKNSEFNTFLFAPIGEDRRGMLLSVLSALARMDVDPWHEAEVLNRMSVATATQRLTTMIGALPNMAASHGDAATIAGRLIALLPHRTGAGVVLPAGLAKLSPGVPSGLLSAAILIAFVLGALSMLMTR